ncbi:MAG: Transcription antitermination protein nusG [Candidatus Giovannonibacteria bacterium GW2011_GWA2_53_7]|uniref:Transcription termination/antitermination protein NusG n=1 Tax=Candidatus Giovannonibacteria bacterium GW2011_GWA2_53_7 TaxID=1618650 RepID=A0A0G2AW67_9BACT|nr:MAG: Transcription antitermination protein nusG [Candidatus Giovannonibacteria bacterium GW2011_GWA2_53_7]
MAKQAETTKLGRRWYAIHTYSGYEENVTHNLLQRVESMDMEDKIFAVLVPKEKKIKIKNGKRRVVEEKIFPGYVLVEMVVTDDSWYVVRNTPNVTGFIGTGTIPTPISEDEMTSLQKRMGVDDPEFKLDVQKDDVVQIVDGPFKNTEGKVAEIDQARGKVKVLVSMFGRETPVELDFLQIKKS